MMAVMMLVMMMMMMMTFVQIQRRRLNVVRSTALIISSIATTAVANVALRRHT